MQKLEDWGKEQSVIIYIHNKSGLKHSYIVVILGILSLLFLYYSILDDILIVIIGIIPPWYKTFKTIETKSTEDDTIMLRYWCVLSYFLIINRIIGATSSWVFALLKVVIVWILVRDNYSISQKIYDYSIRPILSSYSYILEKLISFVEKTKNSAQQIAKDTHEEIKRRNDAAEKEAKMEKNPFNTSWRNYLFLLFFLNKGV